MGEHMYDFEIGDRVIAVQDNIDDADGMRGKTGIIVDIAASGNIISSVGVQFDEKLPWGHTARGHGKNGHCWYCGPFDVERLESDVRSSPGIESLFE